MRRLAWQRELRRELLGAFLEHGLQGLDGVRHDPGWEHLLQ